MYKRKVESNSSSSNKKIVADPVEANIYGDPTMDVTFKMLFGDDNNKDVLISLLNGLLGFKDAEEIIEVQLNPPDLLLSNISNIKGESGIKSSVDILCTNQGQQKIAIEMQRENVGYILAREQFYMAKLIAGQVNEGEGALDHRVILDTYVIVIAKKNIFTGHTALKDNSLYELTVKPYVFETNQVIPGNKMNWKFFELTKFKDSGIYKDHLINRDSDIKLQWLEFLVDCAKQTSEPDRNEIIKKGYGIMNKAIWESDQETLYLKQKMDEASFDYAMKEQIGESFETGKLKGEIIGKLKGEIKTVKTLLKYKIDTSKILKELQYLNKDQKTEENIKYISDHIEDTESVICNELGLLDEFSNEQSEIIGASGLDSSSIMES